MADSLAEGQLEGRAYEGQLTASRWRSFWIVLVAGLVLLALGLLLQAMLPAETDARLARTSWASQADGFRGLREVLRRLGFATKIEARSWGALAEEKAMAPQSLLLQLAPLDRQHLEALGGRMGTAQVRALRAWIEAGGIVLVSAEEEGDLLVAESFGSELAPRVLRPMQGSLEGFGVLEGLQAQVAEAPRGFTLPSLLQWRRATAGSIEAQTPLFAATGGWEVLARLGGKPLMLSKSIGQGRLVVVASALPFSNAGLGLLGFGPFALAALGRLSGLHASTASEPDRRVLFDEYVHGFRQRRGLLTWVFESSLFWPCASLFLLVLLLAWRGSMSAAAAKALKTQARRAKEEYVIAVAELERREQRFALAGRGLVLGFSVHRTGACRKLSREQVETYLARAAKIRSLEELAKFAAALRQELDMPMALSQTEHS